MVQFEELLLKLQALKPEIDDLSDALGMKGMLSEIQQLELKATEPGFWDDVEKSQKVLQRTGSLKGKVEAYEGLVAKYEDTHALIELANEEEDESLLEEAESEVEAVKENLEKQRLQTLLTGEYDKNNAILTFHAGSGGTEAQDWAEMLYRMYTRWAEAHGFKVKEVDYLDGDEAGLKSAVLLVEGENAYGYLKSEAGVHRLVRVSPFDSAEDTQASHLLRLCRKLQKIQRFTFRPKISKWMFTVPAVQAVRRSTRLHLLFVLLIFLLVLLLPVRLSAVSIRTVMLL